MRQCAHRDALRLPKQCEAIKAAAALDGIRGPGPESRDRSSRRPPLQMAYRSGAGRLVDRKIGGDRSSCKHLLSSADRVGCSIWKRSADRSNRSDRPFRKRASSRPDASTRDTANPSHLAACTLLSPHLSRTVPVDFCPERVAPISQTQPHSDDRSVSFSRSRLGG